MKQPIPARRIAPESLLRPDWLQNSGQMQSKRPRHVYEVPPRKDKRGVDLISDALPFGALWYAGPNATSNAVDYAKFYSRSHDAVIRVYDESGNVIEMHQHANEFKKW